MILDVDLTSAVPPFEQVRAQLSAMITTGTLTAGRRPPARHLARMTRCRPEQRGSRGQGCAAQVHWVGSESGRVRWHEAKD